MKSPRVGIVIVTHNNQDVIEACLQSIKQISFSNIVPLIIDNASTDQTVSILKTFKNISLIENRKNSSFAEGNNQGITVCLQKKCDYILLLNPDTEVKPSIIENLLKGFVNDQVGIVGAAITYQNSKTIWYAGGTCNRIFWFTRHDKMNTSTAHLDGSVHKTDFVTGCCMMVRHEVFETIGLLDTSFGFYFEDTDFCLRAKSAGFSSQVIEIPLVLHRISSSTGIAGSNSLTPFKAFFFGRNPFILMKHHAAGIGKFTGMFGQLFIRLPFHGFSMIRRKDWWALFEYLRGMREGTNIQ